MTAFSDARSPHSLLDKIWRVVGAPTTGVALLLAVIAILILSALVPQLPLDLQPGSLEAQRWLTLTAASYGAVGSLLHAVGLFVIRQAIWWHLALALLALHLLVRLGDAIWLAIELHRPANLTFPPALHGGSASSVGHWTQVSPLPEVADQVVANLRDRFSRVLRDESGPDLLLYVDRHRVGALGWALTFFSLLLILLAVFLDRTAAWRHPDVILLPRQTVAVPEVKDIHLRLETVSGGTSPEARLLILEENGKETERFLRTNAATHYRGLGFYLQRVGPLLQVSGADPDGSPLLLAPLTGVTPGRTSITLRFDRPQAERGFAVPARDAVFRIVPFDSLPEQRLVGPAFLVQVFRGDSAEPIFSEFIAQDSDLTIDRAQYHFTIGHYAVLTVIWEPGFPLLLGSSLLLLVSLVLALMRPPTQIWMRLTRAGRATHATAVVSIWSKQQEAQRELEKLQAQVQAEVKSGAGLR